MRLIVLLAAATLLSAPAIAGEDPTAPAPPTAVAPAPAGGSGLAGTSLPVSLDRIRAALEHASPRLLNGVEDQPTFRVDILEQQKIQELLATLDFKGGPTPLGGIYGYEQQRLVTPPVDYPSEQPYGAFNQAQLLTILAENLAGKYLVGRVADTLARAEHARAAAGVQREIGEAIAAYCGSQPDRGAGIAICTNPP